MLPSEVSLIVHSDDAHSYIEATTELVHALNIAQSISSFSYSSPNGDRYYLEGDVDAQILIDALSSHNVSFSFKEKLYDKPCHIRQYPRAGVNH